VSGWISCVFDHVSELISVYKWISEKANGYLIGYLKTSQPVSQPASHPASQPASQPAS
jgi:hypothetical protein